MFIITNYTGSPFTTSFCLMVRIKFGYFLNFTDQPVYLYKWKVPLKVKTHFQRLILTIFLVIHLNWSFINAHPKVQLQRRFHHFTANNFKLFTSQIPFCCLPYNYFFFQFCMRAHHVLMAHKYLYWSRSKYTSEQVYTHNHSSKIGNWNRMMPRSKLVEEHTYTRTQLISEGHIGMDVFPFLVFRES